MINPKIETGRLDIPENNYSLDMQLQTIKKCSRVGKTQVMHSQQFQNNQESFATLNILLDSSRGMRQNESKTNFATMNPLNHQSSLMTMRSMRTTKKSRSKIGHGT